MTTPDNLAAAATLTTPTQPGPHPNCPGPSGTGHHPTIHTGTQLPCQQCTLYVIADNLPRHNRSVQADEDHHLLTLLAAAPTPQPDATRIITARLHHNTALTGP